MLRPPFHKQVMPPHKLSSIFLCLPLYHLLTF